MVFLQGERLLYGIISGGGGNNSHVTPAPCQNRFHCLQIYIIMVLEILSY